MAVCSPARTGRGGNSTGFGMPVATSFSPSPEQQMVIDHRGGHRLAPAAHLAFIATFAHKNRHLRDKIAYSEKMAAKRRACAICRWRWHAQ
jgi:hypothetical protein